MLKPELITGPTVEVISLADLKADLRIAESDFDDQLTRLRARAIRYLDGHSGILGRAIGLQTWEQPFAWLSGQMRLPLGPFKTLDEIRYYDLDNVEQTLGEAFYSAHEDFLGPYITLKYSADALPATYIRDDAVRVRWTCGMAATDAEVDERIVAAVSMLVGHFYQNPEATTIDRQSPAFWGVNDMLAPLRKPL